MLCRYVSRYHFVKPSTQNVASLRCCFIFIAKSYPIIILHKPRRKMLRRYVVVLYSLGNRI